MSIKVTTESFITKAAALHYNKYSYTETVYTTAKTNVIITCPIHGNFKQTPTNHLSGKGCPECAKQTTKEKLAKTTEMFIQEASIKHNNLYTYPQAVYTGNKNKIAIECATHGTFFQEAKSHLTGHGCPDCANQTRSGAWSYSEWEAAGIKSSKFDGFKLYLLKCWNEAETFYKIGKTFTTISTRFVGFPYQWVLIDTIEGDARTISELEQQLHTTYKDYSYTPLQPFRGKTECFNTVITSLSNITLTKD